MDINGIKQLVKDREGIRTATSRDSLITAIIEGVRKELLDDYNLQIDLENAYHIMFLVDYSTFRYENPKEGMPRNLKFRLHNLIIGG